MATAGSAATGMMGHVDMEGNLREYPESMMKFGDTYTDAGKYTSPGTMIRDIWGLSLQGCQTECSAFKDCQAIETGDGSCILRGKGTYPNGPRIPSDDVSLYVRERAPELSQTCTGESVIITPRTWDSYPKGKPMTVKTMCGYAEMNEAELAELTSLRNELDTLLKDIKGKIGQINSHDAALTEDLDQTRDQLARDIAEYQSIHDKYAEAKKDSTAYAGRVQSTLYQSVMEHSYFVLWGTVAALATLGAAYFFEKRPSS